MSNRIQLRRDSTYNWNNINPILADGEPGLDYDTNKIKIGDGSSYWSDLPWATGTAALATVATTGNYNDLSNLPSIPQSVAELIGSSIGYSSSNNRQFLRWKAEDSSIEFSSDFRVVPFSSVVYPGGTIGTDKAGDVAFDESGTYYCYQEPNAYTVTYSGSTNWTPVEYLKLDTKGPGNPPQVGDKLTDGVNTATIASIQSQWGIWYADVYMMLITTTPAVSSWHNGSGSLTVYTGDAPHLNAWAKIGTEVVSAPSTLTSPGVVGQMAYDSNYIYRCTQTNVSEISSVYSTPHSYNGGGNQNAGSSMMNVLDAGGVPAPQVGWIISDGSSQRTITNVVRQNSAWSYIYTLTFSGGDINWNTLNSITIISQPAVSGQWVKAKWFSGSYNDLTDKPSLFSGSYTDLTSKPTIPTDVNQLADSSSLLASSQTKYIMKSSSFTAELGKTYWVDSTSGALTVTLPASPTTGDWVALYDAELKWTTNNLTVNGNGHDVRIMNMGGGGFAWSSPASTVTLNQAVYSPVGPMPNKFLWNGTVWSGSM